MRIIKAWLRMIFAEKQATQTSKVRVEMTFFKVIPWDTTEDFQNTHQFILSKGLKEKSNLEDGKNQVQETFFLFILMYVLILKREIERERKQQDTLRDQAP